MATICKIIIPGSTLQEVEDALTGFLSKKSNFEIEKLDPSLHQDTLSDTFNPNEVDPDHFLIGQLESKVVEIHYNSFGNCDLLSSHLSSKLGRQVVVILYQSVSEAGYFALYREGETFRSLSVGDGEIYQEFGKPLPFEHDPPGHDIGDDEDEFIVFGYEDMDEYLTELGISTETYGDEFDISTMVRLAPKTEPDIHFDPQSDTPTPWWKFW